MLLNMRLAIIPCRKTLRAPSLSLAPTRCATCTEYPEVIAAHMPQKSHRLVDTSPIDAESSAPRRPTIDASIYCIAMLDNCASIAGSESVAVRWSRCRHDRGLPSRMNRMSVFKFKKLLIFCQAFNALMILSNASLRRGRGQA